MWDSSYVDRWFSPMTCRLLFFLHGIRPSADWPLLVIAASCGHISRSLHMDRDLGRMLRELTKVMLDTEFAGPKPFGRRLRADRRLGYRGHESDNNARVDRRRAA